MSWCVCGGRENAVRRRRRERTRRGEARRGERGGGTDLGLPREDPHRHVHRPPRLEGGLAHRVDLVKDELRREENAKHLDVEEVAVDGRVPRDGVLEIDVVVVDRFVDPPLIEEVAEVLLEKSRDALQELGVADALDGLRRGGGRRPPLVLLSGATEPVAWRREGRSSRGRGRGRRRRPSPAGSGAASDGDDETTAIRDEAHGGALSSVASRRRNRTHPPPLCRASRATSARSAGRIFSTVSHERLFPYGKVWVTLLAE